MGAKGPEVGCHRRAAEHSRVGPKQWWGMRLDPRSQAKVLHPHSDSDRESQGWA